MTRVKICGLGSVEQAVACVDAGADALGVNFVPSSVRRTDISTARAIVQAVGNRALVVGVVADLPVAQMRALVRETGVGCLQLHGQEPSADVAALLPHAYKAVPVATAADVALAAAYPGEYLMVDAKVPGRLGGTGRRVDGALVVALARARRLVLAGGLTPENVADAITEARPWCVDVASGVESSVGVKDIAKVKAFILAARGA